MGGSALVYLIAADAILIFHAMFVGFVVFSLPLTLAGGALGWRWVRNGWYRLAHLLAIGIVVVQSWLGIICPLTSWEMALRLQAGGTVYPESFISHWLQAILFYQAPEWVFVAAYSLFGVLVLAAWLLVPPSALFRKSNEG